MGLLHALLNVCWQTYITSTRTYTPIIQTNVIIVPDSPLDKFANECKGTRVGSLAEPDG